MRLRAIALALLLSLVTSSTTAVVLAQETIRSGPTPLINPVAPTSPGPTLELAPNPFRALDRLEPQFGPPGFSEATDPSLLGPAPPSAPARNNRPANNRRPMPTPVSSSRNSTRNNSPFSPRLARAAPIMGDSFAPTIQIQSTDTGGMLDEHSHGPGVLLPQGGGGTRAKIAENSATLPMDRVIFNYNHFHNAISDFNQQSDVDRFTLGFEKTFLSSLFSIDVRLPLIANNDIVTDSFSRNGSELGNLSISLKGLLSSNDDSAFVAGMTIDIPTGQDTSATLNRDIDPLLLVASNDAVHLAPYLGFLCAPGQGMSHQGFLQVDVPTNGNDLQFSDASTATTTTNLLEQSLLYVDYSFSKLMYDSAGNSRKSCRLRRLSGLAELHYTTTLEDSDVVQISTSFNNFQITSFGNRIDVVNLTLGVHSVLDNGTQLRLGTVSPITDGDDRFFDFEFQAQLNIPL